MNLEKMNTLLTEQAGTDRIVGMFIPQIRDIVDESEELAEIVVQDLENGHSLKGLAAEMQKKADEIHHKSKDSCVVITPSEADEVIRKYFGLPAEDQTAAQEPEQEDVILDLESFL